MRGANRQPQAFIFDMDGVIIDSEPLHFDADIRTMAHFGYVIAQAELEAYVGTTNPEMWALLREKMGFSQTVEEVIRHQLALKIEALRASGLAPIEGIKAWLDALAAAGIPVGIASSSPRVFIEAVTSQLGIADRFACVVSGEEVPRGKPAPDVYLEAARLLGAEPQACVVLEDSRNGVRAAKAAGMRCIGYVNPGSGQQDLSEADCIITAIAELTIEGLAELGQRMP